MQPSLAAVTTCGAYRSVGGDGVRQTQPEEFVEGAVLRLLTAAAPPAHDITVITLQAEPSFGSVPLSMEGLKFIERLYTCQKSKTLHSTELARERIS